MKIAAVWGASGYIGSNLIVALLADGWNVRAILRSAESLPIHLKTQVKDIKLLQFKDDEQVFLDALDQVDILFNCVGEPTNDVAKTSLYLEGIKKLVSTVNKTQVSKLIHLSTVAVYGETSQMLVTTESPLNGIGVYARNRIQVEQILLSSISNSVKVVIVRIPMVVGSSMTSDLFRRIYNTLILRIFFHTGTKNSRLNCIGINKLIQILLFLAKVEINNSRVLQFSDYVTWVEIVELIQKITKNKIKRIYVSPFFVGLFSYLIFRRNIKKEIAIFNNELVFASSEISPKDLHIDKISTIEDVEAALKSRISR